VGKGLRGKKCLVAPSRAAYKCRAGSLLDTNVRLARSRAAYKCRDVLAPSRGPSKCREGSHGPARAGAVDEGTGSLALAAQPKSLPNRLPSKHFFEGFRKKFSRYGLQGTSTSSRNLWLV